MFLYISYIVPLMNYPFFVSRLPLQSKGDDIYHFIGLNMFLIVMTRSCKQILFPFKNIVMKRDSKGN
jgi:hypothetical protein